MEPKTHESKIWFVRFRAWLIAFFVPFLSAGVFAANGWYKHGVADLERWPDISPPTPVGYAENFGGTVVVFCIAGVIAGLIGLSMFAAFRGIVQGLGKSTPAF